MASNSVSYFVAQLGYQLPILLMYLVAMIVALIFMGRAPLPATLTLVGSLILLGAAVVMPMIQYSMFRGGVPNQFMIGVVILSGSIIRAIGTCLLVAAAFVGRSLVAVRYDVSGPGQPPAT